MTGLSLERTTAFLRNLLGDGEGEDAGADTRSQTLAVGRDPADRSDVDAADDAAGRAWFLARLRGLVDQGGSSVAGHVQMLSLAVVRERLGPMWPTLAPRAMRIARAVIEDRLGPRDVAVVYDDASFLILFAEAAGAEARLMCLALAREVVESLIGDALIDPTNREGVAELKSACLTPASLRSFLADAETALVPPLPPEILAQPAETLSVDEAAAEVAASSGPPDRAAATAAPADGWLSGDGSGDAKTARRSAVPSAGAMPPQGDEGWRFYDFLPFSNAVAGRIVGYRVTWPQNRPRLPEGDESQILLADLDRLTAARWAHEALQARREEALIMVPIYFATLRRMDRRRLLSRAIAKFDPVFRRHLVIDFHGLPTGLPGQRAYEIVGSFHGAARASVLRLPTLGDLANLPPGLHLHAAIADWREIEQRIEGPQRCLEALVAATARLGMRLFVGHVDRPEALALVTETGARYASGLAVGGFTRDVRGLSLTGSANGGEG